MSHLPRLSGRVCIVTLSKAGFIVIRQRGISANTPQPRYSRV